MVLGDSVREWYSTLRASQTMWPLDQWSRLTYEPDRMQLFIPGAKGIVREISGVVRERREGFSAWDGSIAGRCHKGSQDKRIEQCPAFYVDLFW